MRIWQRVVFSSPVFLSHHLFGCARIHWNVFTRCQNSGNSTPFGSSERKDEVITGVVWKGEPGGVSVPITKETIYGVIESKVSVTSLRIYFWSRSQEWMPWRFSRFSMREASREAAYCSRTIPVPAWNALKEKNADAHSTAWEIPNLVQVHFCHGLEIQLVSKSFQRQNFNFVY